MAKAEDQVTLEQGQLESDYENNAGCNACDSSFKNLLKCTEIVLQLRRYDGCHLVDELLSTCKREEFDFRSFQ